MRLIGEAMRNGIFPGWMMLGKSPSLRDRLLANPVVILNGQSNAVGAVGGSNNTTSLLQYLGGDLLSWDMGAGAFATLEDLGGGVSTDDGITGAGQIGTLMMRRIADVVGGDVKLFAGGYTSQGIGYFDPDSATNAYYLDNSQHGSLNNYDLLSGFVSASGENVGLIVFIQGEANAGMDQPTYYATLRKLILQWKADYPLAGVILVLTNELLVGNTQFTGVNAAKLQAASEFSHVVTVDARDLTGATAYQMPLEYHYTSMLGYEEVGERVAAKALGLADRADVPDVDDLLDNGQSWVARWRSIYQGTVTTVGTIVDQVGGVALSGGTNPLLVRNDSSYGNRSSVEWDGATTTKSAAVLTGVTSTTWTIAAAAKLNSTANYQMLCELFTGAGRVGFYIHLQSNKPGVWINGSGISFANAPNVDLLPHWYQLAIDTTEARLYVDGALVDTVAITPVSLVTPAVHYGSLLSVTQYFDGSSAEFALATDACTLEQAVAGFAYAQAEYKGAFAA